MPTFQALLACPVVVFVACGAALAGELRVEADFDNGSAIARKIDQENRIVTISPRQVRESRNIWWHLRISGIEPGETVQLEVVDFDAVANEINPVYSYDGRTWHRMDDRRTPHRQKFTEPSVWIARNIPYPYGASLKLAEQLQDNPHVEVSDLCRSEEDRAVKLLRITDRAAPERGKKAIWVQARQHAFESHSSRVAQGLARWLAGDSPEADRLRRGAIVHIVPIMDVDSVAVGGAGKDQKPVDFNRCWGDSPHWNAVRAAIAKIDELHRRHTLVCFIDLHNPWYADSSHWHLYGPERNQQNARAFTERFVAALKTMEAANSWTNRLNNQYGLAAGRDQMSNNYAARTWLAESERGFNITMEAPHWKDADGKYITVEGLHDYGQALGMAMLELVE